MVNVEDDELYVIMELYDTDLHRIIQSPQTLGDAHFKHFLYQLLRGLRFAHSYGIIHRDLKPANLLVTKNCDLCISDFGLARQIPTGTASPLMTEHVVTRWYRAPELMLSADGHYSAAIDMWSVGCIFAELLGRNPLFAGKDFMETLRMQIDVLGTRPDDELTYIRSDQALAFLASLPKREQVPWTQLFPDATEKAVDLLDKMLQFHPNKRITVEDAIHHPYFDSVRSQYPDSDPVLPVGALQFTFEGDDSLTVAHYKRLIVEEVATFRAEKALARRIRAEKVGTNGVSSSSTAMSIDDDSNPAFLTNHNDNQHDETMVPVTTNVTASNTGTTSTNLPPRTTNTTTSTVIGRTTSTGSTAKPGTTTAVNNNSNQRPPSSMSYSTSAVTTTTGIRR